MFHEHIHKIMEVYVDDILVKSKQGQDHLQALEEVFTILQRYKKDWHEQLPYALWAYKTNVCIAI